MDRKMPAVIAMKLSEREDRIVHLLGSPGLHADILQDADGSTLAEPDSNGLSVIEYWGDCWRIHVHG